MKNSLVNCGNHLGKEIPRREDVGAELKDRTSIYPLLIFLSSLSCLNLQFFKVFIEPIHPPLGSISPLKLTIGIKSFGLFYRSHNLEKILISSEMENAIIASRSSQKMKSQDEVYFMAFETNANAIGLEGHSIMRPPLFNGDNYSYWKIRMRLFIQVNDYEV